jgi:hypothetical protein
MSHLMANSKIADVIHRVSTQFRDTYHKGIALLHNDTGAFLSFSCCLMALEALGAFIKPNGSNSERLKTFVQSYLPEPLRSQADKLWEFRNAMVHAFSPGPYVLTHFHRNLHLTTHSDGRTVLNAEDFYDALVKASERYFEALASDGQLQLAFLQRVGNRGEVVVLPIGDLPSA